MRKMILVCSIALLLLSLTQSQQVFNKMTPSSDPEAKCLDGSSPAVYVHQGSNPSNILIYMTGNTSCEVGGGSINQNIESCIKLSKTVHGSSDLLPQTLDGSTLGFLGGNEQNNKFASWTKIIIPNCDGTVSQSYNKNIVEMNGENIYFRGSVNIRSLLKWIDDKYGYKNASKVVLAGSSIGGVGVTLWINYLKSLVQDSAKVYGVVDSGLFQDLSHTQHIFNTYSEILYLVGLSPSLQGRRLQTSGVEASAGSEGSLSVQSKVQNSWSETPASILDGLQNFHSQVLNPDGSYPNTNCVQNIKDKYQVKCLFPVHSFPFLQTKLLWLQPQYDTYLFKYVFPLQCLKVDEETLISSPQNCPSGLITFMDIIKSKNMHAGLQPLAEAGHSVWSNACGWHTALIINDIYDSDNYRASVSGKKLTAKEAVETFVFDGEQVVEIDPYSWPSNAGCAFIN